MFALCAASASERSCGPAWLLICRLRWLSEGISSAVTSVILPLVTVIRTWTLPYGVPLCEPVNVPFTAPVGLGVGGGLRRVAVAVGRPTGRVVAVLDLCADYAQRTGGYFTATPGGRLDPSGLVKGWAIARASALLSAAGLRRHAVNGGGDVQTVGSPSAGEMWRIGVTDPLHPQQLATVVAGNDIAVATSGIAERGHHIVDPFTGRPATDVASATVVGPDIVGADVYATAAVAMGPAAREWLLTLPGYAGFLVDAAGERWQTPGFAEYAAAAETGADDVSRPAT